MNIFKKIKLFFIYLKIIKINKGVLGSYNLRVDKAKRLYTIFTIEDTETIDVYGRSYFDIRYAEFKISMENIFLSVGLSELIALYSITKIDSNNYLVIFSYSGFNSVIFYRIMIFLSIILFIALNFILFTYII